MAYYLFGEHEQDHRYENKDERVPFCSPETRATVYKKASEDFVLKRRILRGMHQRSEQAKAEVAAEESEQS